jgi:hypothetical protein
MSSAAPLTPAYAPVASASMRWVPGAASVGLAVLSFALNGIGYAMAHPGRVDCPVTEIWRGTLFAVASVGTAVPGLLCGTAGVASRRTNRPLALAGLALNAAFGWVFYALWT